MPFRKTDHSKVEEHLRMERQGREERRNIDVAAIIGNQLSNFSNFSSISISLYTRIGNRDVRKQNPKNLTQADERDTKRWKIIGEIKEKNE